MKRRRAASLLVFVLANAAGLAAFAWPLLLGAAPTTEGGAHAADAPLLVLVIVPALVWLALDEARGTGSDARTVALLGALVAVNAVLRIPKGPSGEGLVFVLPILAGWWIGGRFAFLLGAFTMLTSAVVTAGVGPWLPFQMLALGWVGLFAGGLRRLLRGKLPTLALSAYAYASSIAYGAVINLWFWPFMGRSGELFFAPGLGITGTLERYGRFYLVTSLAWDTGRALLTNVPLVAILARPVGSVLSRARERLDARVTPWTQDDVVTAPAFLPPASPDGIRAHPPANSPTRPLRP